MKHHLLADKWILFNNAGAKPEIIAKKQNEHIDVLDSDLFAKIMKESGAEI